MLARNSAALVARSHADTSATEQSTLAMLRCRHRHPRSACRHRGERRSREARISGRAPGMVRGTSVGGRRRRGRTTRRVPAVKRHRTRPRRCRRAGAGVDRTGCDRAGLARRHAGPVGRFAGAGPIGGGGSGSGGCARTFAGRRTRRRASVSRRRCSSSRDSCAEPVVQRRHQRLPARRRGSCRGRVPRREAGHRSGAAIDPIVRRPGRGAHRRVPSCGGNVMTRVADGAVAIAAWRRLPDWCCCSHSRPAA